MVEHLILYQNTKYLFSELVPGKTSLSKRHSKTQTQLYWQLHRIFLKLQMQMKASSFEIKDDGSTKQASGQMIAQAQRVTTHTLLQAHNGT